MAAVFHQGENIFVTSVVAEPVFGQMNLDDYDVKVEISDRLGRDKRTFEEANEMVQLDPESNLLYLFLSGNITATMEGIYFTRIELWYNGQKLKTNELNNFEIIR